MTRLCTVINCYVCTHSGAAYSGAEAEIQYLITRNGLPFLPTPMGKGVITDDHPLCVAAARSRLTVVRVNHYTVANEYLLDPGLLAQQTLSCYLVPG